jgi:hypothetical protein
LLRDNNWNWYCNDKYLFNRKAYIIMRWLLNLMQSEKLLGWDKKCNGKPTGASGGRFTYLFTPTSLGLVIKVKCNLCGDEIDLTEYNEW